MVVRDREDESAWCGVEQRQPEQRRPGEIEASTAVLVEKPHEFRLGPGDGEIDLPPRHLHRVENNLRGYPVVVHERGPQIRVAGQQSGGGRAQANRVDLAFEVDPQLGRVDVHRLRGQRGMEQQPRLQRRQRPHVLQRREPLLPAVDLLLVRRHQRKVGRCQTARIRSCRVRGESLQGTAPQVRERRDLRIGEDAGRERERRP
ncbi:hypothetical protein MLGJGCBP_03004 [Rhodococcus sp. T7]|nr:hypothetical protein MLGJGCBP_03004 [Rhodococcus sp. T7]